VAFTLTIIAFFVGLMAIVMIHEFGHYVAARAFGFRVLEYFVGFGPRLWSIRKGEIDYGVKAIPAGGYVKIAGMNPFVDDVPPGDENRAYFAKPIWQRAVVIVAGPLSHFVVAGLIFAVVLIVWGTPAPPYRVDAVAREFDGRRSPAAEAGVQPGDVIVRIDGISNPDVSQIGDVLEANVGRPVELVVQRDGREVTLQVAPRIVEDAGESVARIGVNLSATTSVKPSAPSAIVHGYRDVGELTWLSVREIGRVFGPEGVGRVFTLLFTDEERRSDDAASVVGISRQVGTIGEQRDWQNAVFLFGYVTLFVGLVNLIPLPPFDGGHLAMLLVEKIRGRRVDMRKLVPVSAVVLTFLVLFTTATVALDIWKPLPTFAP
jgi:membrane-associated protease RseP (regulator of RpoE activity)